MLQTELDNPPRAVSIVPLKEEWSMTRQRRRFSAPEKVAILRRHLKDRVEALKTKLAHKDEVIAEITTGRSEPRCR